MSKEDFLCSILHLFPPMQAVISLSKNKVCAEFEATKIQIKCIRISYIRAAV